MFSRCFNPIFIVDIKLGSLFLQEVAAFQDIEVNFFSEVTVANGTTQDAAIFLTTATKIQSRNFIGNCGCYSWHLYA